MSELIFGSLILILKIPIQFMILNVVLILFVSPFYSRKIYYSMIFIADLASLLLIYNFSNTKFLSIKDIFISNSIETLFFVTLMVILVAEILHWSIPNLLKTEEALKITEENFRDLVENANSIILTLDKNGIITSINNFGLKFFGYNEKDIVGANLIGTIVPEFDSNGNDMKNLVNEILSNEDRFRSNLNENIKKNGERVWIYWTDKVIRNTKGELESILSIGSDITELKLALSQIEKNIHYFATSVDQIRNPLAIISGIAELKIQDKKLSERILTQIDRINEIILRLDTGWHESEEVKKFLKNREMLSYLYEDDSEDII
ncbi:MAG: PAS domain S-box protein [Candidatus Methanofastidiosa archaeon]|nr:PAS domain S-box protein [Candidatus Methanofastidiosa archaeon]